MKRLFAIGRKRLKTSMGFLRTSRGQIFITKNTNMYGLSCIKRAWRMAESVLPSFADGFADWLGAHVIIVAVSPNPSNGEITMQS